MSRTYKQNKGHGQRRDRRIVVRGVPRQPIDVEKLSRAVIDLARAQAEADAEAQARQAGSKEAS